MNELKPCPFCGKDAILFPHDKKDIISYDVMCGGYDCWMQYGADWYLSKDHAIKLWNKRINNNEK